MIFYYYDDNQLPVLSVIHASLYIRPKINLSELRREREFLEEKLNKYKVEKCDQQQQQQKNAI